jgi:hypothetical protein
MRGGDEALRGASDSGIIWSGVQKDKGGLGSSGDVRVLEEEWIVMQRSLETKAVADESMRRLEEEARVLLPCLGSGAWAPSSAACP